MANLILQLADAAWWVAAGITVAAVFLACIICAIALPHVFKDIGGGK